jgi:hypothetical protein
MVICPECQIEYEEGKKFCQKCGIPLAAKQETPSKHEKIEEKPVMKLICPSCNLGFEQGKFCKKCGSPLIEQTPSKVEGIKSPASDVKKEAQQGGIPQTKSIEGEEKPLICPKCGISYEAGKFCKKCGSPLVNQTSLPPKEELKTTVTPEVMKEVPKVIVPKKEEVKGIKKAEIKKEPPPVKIPERPAVPKAKGKFLRPLPIAIVGIIFLIAIGGYFLWPKYSYLIKKKPPATMEVSKESTPLAPSPRPSVPTSAGKEATEAIAIKTMLENIRQANLQKNIDLFMSCYSVDFKDREARKNSTLENWQNFSYSDLLYNLKSQTVSGDKANIKVEWIIRYSPVGGGKAQETKSVLDVSLKKEDGIWRIKESKSVN